MKLFTVKAFFALYRGVTANMLVGVAGAGVLAGYDQLSRIVYKHNYNFESQKAYK